MNNKKRIKNRGSALPLVLVAIIILLTMGTALLSMGLSNRIYTIRNTSDIIARCAADAGLTQALFEMNQKLRAKTLEGGTLPWAYKSNLSECDGVYSYMVAGNLVAGYNIISVGQADNAQRIISASIDLQGIFDHAILTKNDLILKSGTNIDGYNSAVPGDTDNDVKIGTQSTDDDSIVLNNGVIINGDVSVGIGGSVEDGIKDLGATVNGDKHIATRIPPMPDIVIPALPNMGTSLSVKSGTITLTEADSGAYTGIKLDKGKDIGILEISEGDVELHITGDIDLGQACEIVIKEGATLTIYVDGNITCDNGSGINTEAPPEQASTLQLYGTGDEEQFLDVKAKSEWTGTIYAPDAEVVLYAGGDAYGSIVADSFEFKSGGNFYYDEALREVDKNDQGVSFVVTRWNEGKINYTPNMDLGEFRIDDVGILEELK